MIIPGKEIADILESQLKKKADNLRAQGVIPQLTTILIGESPDQLSYVSKKKEVAGRLGINFEFLHYSDIPSFEKLIGLLKDLSRKPEVTGMIIQQPLPPQLQTDSIYNFIPDLKEIEAHKIKTPYYPPISMAILTVLKYIVTNQNIDQLLPLNLAEDRPLIKKYLKHKKIVLAGRGITGGQPIGKTLNQFKINYMSINSRTLEPEEYYKNADIIITAVGKKVIQKECLKPGVILLNAGLRRENGKLVGDYDESEIVDIASFYTPTPGGIGPIDVLYLYHNLLEAAQKQCL